MHSQWPGLRVEVKYLCVGGSNCSGCSPVLLHKQIVALAHILTDDPQSRKLFPNKIVIFCLLERVYYSLLQNVVDAFKESQSHRMVEVCLTWLNWSLHLFFLCSFRKVKASQEHFSFPICTVKFFFRNKPEWIATWDLPVVSKVSAVLHFLMLLNGERWVPGLPSESLCIGDKVCECREGLYLSQKERDQTTLLPAAV